MKRRAVGIETEYGTFPGELRIRRGKRKIVVDPREDYKRYYQRLIKAIGRPTISDQFLENGARFYKDVGNHPEYATPECSSVRELVTHDTAGEIVVAEELPDFWIIKNNAGSNRRSFGCHENYSVESHIFNATELAKLLPFLVTRQIYSGAGGVMNGSYHLSQRATYMKKTIGGDTLSDRGIINMRDRSYSDCYKRLHLIVGDANVSELSTFMKMGATCIVLDLLEDGWIPDIQINNPLGMLQSISANQNYINGKKPKWPVKDTAGVLKTKRFGTVSAIDIQRKYLKAAKRYVSRDKETNEILGLWEETLDCLGRDPMELGYSYDCFIKRLLLEQEISRKGIDWKNPIIQEVDFKYHDVHRDRGIFYKFQRRNGVYRIADEDDIEDATEVPPRDTRAWVRGNAVSFFIKEGLKKWDVDWAYVNTPNGRRYNLGDPLSSYDEVLEKIYLSV
jgi:proteasome accessory factor A